MEYVCPMTCPKNMRNGPCGGTLNGQCEVIPEKPCIWVAVYDRAKAAHRVDELKTYIPPRNRALEGTSSYINYFLDRDSRPGAPAAVDHDRQCDGKVAGQKIALTSSSTSAGYVHGAVSLAEFCQPDR